MSLILLYIFIPVVFGMNNTNYVYVNNNVNNDKINNIHAEFHNTSKAETTKVLDKKNISSTAYMKQLLHYASKVKQHIPTKKQFIREHIKRDLSDMPMKSDLGDFLDSLHKVLDFFLENKQHVDISVNYGLFLINVNLRKLYSHKRDGVPSAVSFNLKHILEKNEVLLNFFKKMVESDFNPNDDLSKSLTNLFNHERLWISRIQAFNGAHVNETVTEEYHVLEQKYSSWDKYLESVGDFSKAMPRPDQSNKCLADLAANHASKDSWKKKCRIPEGCRKPLARGSDYGYGLTHRLLFLQLAYYGYRCHVFSNKKDQELRYKFCKKLYSEATYISLNEYGAIDLFVEQICLCALDGHFEFLRRSWLQTVIEYQTQSGCFSDVPAEERPQKPEFESALQQNWKLDKGEYQYILGGQCNVHTSAAAAATLSFGIKFIVETYY